MSTVREGGSLHGGESAAAAVEEGHGKRVEVVVVVVEEEEVEEEEEEEEEEVEEGLLSAKRCRVVVVWRLGRPYRRALKLVCGVEVWRATLAITARRTTKVSRE
jgi:hypothetical protein